MVAITRKVSNLATPLRQALEAAAGSALPDKQRVVIELPDAAAPQSAAGDADAALPDWCTVYEGLGEGELAALDAVVSKRAVMGRATA